MTVSHFRGLVAVLLVVFALAIVAVQMLASNANERLVEQQIGSCERGNAVRDYLAFDNEQRITRLEQQLRNPAQITEADQRAFTAELERRYVQRADLSPFDCQTLR